MARAKNLLGPWEKYAKNLVLTDAGKWRCPGHGTAVEMNGRFYFLYHACNKQTSVYTGRQALLTEFTFTDDGWVCFLPRTDLPASPKPVQTTQTESFTGSTLSDAWQWSVFQQPVFRLRQGNLLLNAAATPLGSAVAQRTLSGDYTVTTTVALNRSSAQPGLAAIGDDDNALGISTDDKTVRLWKLERKQWSVLATRPMPASRSVTLRLTARNGHLFTFAYATNGKQYQPLNTEPVEGAFLPPWDRAVRVGLTAQGQATQRAVFTGFTVQNTN